MSYLDLRIGTFERQSAIHKVLTPCYTGLYYIFAPEKPVTKKVTCAKCTTGTLHKIILVVSSDLLQYKVKGEVEVELFLSDSGIFGHNTHKLVNI